MSTKDYIKDSMKYILLTTLLLPAAVLSASAALPNKDNQKSEKDSKGSLDDSEKSGTAVATAADIRYFAESPSGEKLEISKELVQASELLRGLQGAVFPLQQRFFNVLKDSIRSFEQLLRAHKNALLLKKKNDKETMAYLMENMREDIEVITAATMQAEIQVFLKYGQMSELAYYLGLPNILCEATQGILVKAGDIAQTKMTPEMENAFMGKMDACVDAFKQTWNDEMMTGFWRAHLLLKGVAHGACSTIQDLIHLEYGVKKGNWRELNFGVLGLTSLDGLSQINNINNADSASFAANPIYEITAQQVACMRSVEYLDLSSTYISTISADVITALPNLKSLTLTWCSNIKSLPKSTIEALAKLQHFNMLRVDDNPLDDETKKMLQACLPGKYELGRPYRSKSTVTQAASVSTASTAAAASTNN